MTSGMQSRGKHDQLADACGVDIDKCEDTQVLMDKCLAEIEKEEKER